MKIKTASPDACKLFFDGAIALAQVEANGIRVDTEYLAKQTEVTTSRIKEIRSALEADRIWSTWRREYGTKAKLRSDQQLSRILFDIMGFPKPEYTERSKDLEEGERRYKMDEGVLQGIDHPFVQGFIEYKKLHKVRDTYLKGIHREVDQYGILHPFFNLSGGGGDDEGGGPATYRSSSGNPNFQNFPARNKKLAEMVRRCIRARKGRRIVEFDFKGIEVAVAACYNKDPVLIDYVKHSPPKDMHRDRAMEWFMLKENQVDKLIRNIAKNELVFPLFYGSYYIDCAKAAWDDLTKLHPKVGGDGADLMAYLKKKGIRELGACDQDIPPRKGTFEYHTKAVQDRFWEVFKVYDQWKKDYYDRFLDRGWLKMYTGFVCTWAKRGVPVKNDVTNYPVQGSAFHCLLWCLIQLQKWLNKKRMRSLIIGQIHDSCLGDVVEDELEDLVAKALEIMTVDLPRHWPWIIVPMTVETEITPRGGTWFEKTGYELGGKRP